MIICDSPVLNETYKENMADSVNNWLKLLDVLKQTRDGYGVTVQTEIWSPKQKSPGCPDFL